MSFRYCYPGASINQVEGSTRPALVPHPQSSRKVCRTGAGSQQGVRENWELKILAGGGSKEDGVKGGKDEKEKEGEVKRTKTAEERKPQCWTSKS